MYRWRYLDGGGEETGTSDRFDDRAAAEAWLGETWSDLLDRGVEEVALTDGERTLYRMGLREA